MWKCDKAISFPRFPNVIYVLISLALRKALSSISILTATSKVPFYCLFPLSSGIDLKPLNTQTTLKLCR